MRIRFSNHARAELARRGISEADIEKTASEPEQIVSGHGNLKVYQSRLEREGKRMLLRVVVAVSGDEDVVVTAYLTSKIEKYWRSR